MHAHVQMQEALHLTSEAAADLKQKHGTAKMAAIATLISIHSFMSRLSTKSRRGPSATKRQPMPNPQGKLPKDVRESEHEVRRQSAWFCARGALRAALLDLLRNVGRAMHSCITKSSNRGAQQGARR
jgi:hypothetical protein